MTAIPANMQSDEIPNAAKATTTRRTFLKGMAAPLLATAFAGPSLASEPLAPETVKLPAPRMTGGKPLMEAISLRRSTRTFGNQAIEQQTLSGQKHRLRNAQTARNQHRQCNPIAVCPALMCTRPPGEGGEAPVALGGAGASRFERLSRLAEAPSLLQRGE